MDCHVCGDKLERIITDLPLKISNESIIIIKKIPLLQCPNCSEYLLEDDVMEHIEDIIEKTNKEAELEILQYAV